jgi:PST family polysaccharide transporter
MDFAVLSGGQLLSKVAGFVAFAYLARVLGPKDYGSVEYAIGLAVFFSMIVDLGLGPVGVRELATGEESVERLAANIPLARLGLVLLAIPTMLIVARFSRQSADGMRLVELYAVSLLAAPWTLEWLFQAREMMTAAAAGSLLRMVLYTAGILLFVTPGTSVELVGWIEIVAAFLTALFYLVVQHAYVTPLSFRSASFRSLRALVHQGLGVGGGQIVSAVNMYAPLLLVGTLAGGEETGWFGASHRVVASLSTFSMLYHFNLYPVIARRASGPAEQLDAVIRASLRVVAWASIGGALLLTLLGTELMQLAFGKNFTQAGVSFEVLVWFLPATLLSGHARWFMIAAKRQKYVFYAQVAGVVASVAIGVPFVRFWPARGAAVAMVAGAIAVWAYAHLSATHYVRKIPGVAVTLLPMALAAAVLAVASQIPLSRWIVGPVLVSLYFALAPLLDRALVGDVRKLASAKSDLGAIA